MPVRRSIAEYFGVYSITLTCCKWKHLFQESDGYDAVYKWFDYLKSKGHFILGYVICQTICTRRIPETGDSARKQKI